MGLRSSTGRQAWHAKMGNWGKEGEESEGAAHFTTWNVPAPSAPNSRKLWQGVLVKVCSPSHHLGKEDAPEQDEAYFKRPQRFFGLQQAHLDDNTTTA